MDYLSVKDLKSPRLVREQLRQAGELLLLNNGKPMALMLDLGENENPQTMLDAVHDARSRLAFSRIRDATRRNGAAKISMRDIDREIQLVRAERKASR